MAKIHVSREEVIDNQDGTVTIISPLADLLEVGDVIVVEPPPVHESKPGENWEEMERGERYKPNG